MKVLSKSDFEHNLHAIGKLVERKAEAAAFLQFQGMLAKLKAYNENEARAAKAVADEFSDED